MKKIIKHYPMTDRIIVIRKYLMCYLIKEKDSWSKLQELIQLCNNDIDSLIKARIFCNSSITFNNKPLGFTSFLQSNLRTINDIWDSNNTNYKSCHDIYNLLIDRRNCIS